MLTFITLLLNFSIFFDEAGLKGGGTIKIEIFTFSNFNHKPILACNPKFLKLNVIMPLRMLFPGLKNTFFEN